MSHCIPPTPEAEPGEDFALTAAAERALDQLLPAPEGMVVAAAWRLLELQDRSATGYPEPAISYERSDAPLLARPGVCTVRITGDTGGGATPSIPGAVLEAIEYVDLLAVFEAAREATAHLLPAPLLAGGVWWWVRMEGRALSELTTAAVRPPELRRALLVYEAEVLGGLCRSV